MKILRYILFPFVPIYYLVIWLRNRLYDSGFKKSMSYNFPVICVGNLSVGGTGKTPMIEYLINLLKDDYKIATLSRGYKRKTDGFQLANESSNAESLGDEPFQFYNKFKNDILVAVDADRQNGIKLLKGLENSPEIILLDDAFQHRKVRAGFNILLTTYNNIYTEDFVLPTGNLREPRHGAKRANVIIVTKCPNDLSEFDKSKIIEKVIPEIYQKIFFSTISYERKVISDIKSLDLKELSEFALVTGIANAKPLVDFLDSENLKFEHLNFKDHHEFSKQEILQLEKHQLIITTEKDYMRLKQYKSLKEKLYYLPIKMAIKDGVKFNTYIKEYVDS